MTQTINIPLDLWSDQGLIDLANAFGEELKRWAEDGANLDGPNFHFLDQIFTQICDTIEERGLTVSDHVIVL